MRKNLVMGIILRLLIIFLWIYGGIAAAHELRPSIVDLAVAQDGQLTLRIETNIEARLAGVSASHQDTENSPQAKQYNHYRSLPPEQLKAAFGEFEPRFRKGLEVLLDGETVALELDAIEIPEVGDQRLARKGVLRYSGQVPPGTQQILWRYAPTYGDSAVRFLRPDLSEPVSYWVKSGNSSPPFPLSGNIRQFTAGVVWGGYLLLGFEHILPKGVDHILFVLGLFLLSAAWRPLLWQVSAFTLAHTLTLALTIFGAISLSPAIVEPLIALSIAYVALENLFTRELHPWRPALVFLFGLLHGMGFASVLSELGLPEGHTASALIAFNIGVELGQLVVIAIAFLLVFKLLKNPALYRKMVVIPGSALIALTGLYWTWERVLG
jgi:hypothetical protein